MRVVSLCPTATETLCRIGGERFLVGRSQQCDWPPSVVALPSVPSFEALRELRPDVILAPKSGAAFPLDSGALQTTLASIHPVPVLLTIAPASIWDVLDDCLRIGAVVGCADSAERAMVELREAWWTAVDFVNPYEEGPELLFLESVEPLMCAGRWTPELIVSAGARSSLNPPGARSRLVAPQDILAAAPDRVIVCPCGSGIPEIRSAMATLRSERWWPLLPANLGGRERIALVDGNQMFNRPGPRLVDAFRWLTGWINHRPELIPDGFPVELA